MSALVVDLDALGEAQPVLYPITLVLINLTGSERLNLLWLLALIVMLVLVASLDRVFQTPSSGARHTFDGAAFIQDLLLFYVQLGVGRLLPAMLLLPAVALYASQLAGWIRAQLHISTVLEGPAWLVSALFIGLAYVAQDLARYVSHRVQHRVGWLWELHKFHHSAQSLSPMTLFREHPVILMINGAVVGFATFVVSAAVLVFCPQLDGRPVELLGGLVAFMLIKTQVLLAHFHRPISLGLLDRWLITPAVHAVHHSVDEAHLNRNFGTTLTWWDRSFGTYHQPVADELTRLQYGTDETPTHVAGKRLPIAYLYGTLTLNAVRLLFRQLVKPLTQRRI